MKKSRICLCIIFILLASCEKSRVATTARHYRDGKVTYTNHYANKRMTRNRHKTHTPAPPTRDASAKTAGNPVNDPDPVTKMNLMASADKNFLVLNNMERLIRQYSHSLYPESRHENEPAQSKHAWNTLTADYSTGSLKEISRGDSTVAKKRDTGKKNAAGTEKTDIRKTEKLGLAGFILSFFGMIPLLGIPFAVLAIIFGANSLKRIKRNPEKYKGKGFATASLVMGCAMIVMNIIILITSISAASSTPPVHYNSSANSCRV